MGGIFPLSSDSKFGMPKGKTKKGNWRKRGYISDGTDGIKTLTNCVARVRGFFICEKPHFLVATKLYYPREALSQWRCQFQASAIISSRFLFAFQPKIAFALWVSAQIDTISPALRGPIL